VSATSAGFNFGLAFGALLTNLGLESLKARSDRAKLGDHTLLGELSARLRLSDAVAGTAFASGVIVEQPVFTAKYVLVPVWDPTTTLQKVYVFALPKTSGTWTPAGSIVLGNDESSSLISTNDVIISLLDSGLLKGFH